MENGGVLTQCGGVLTQCGGVLTQCGGVLTQCGGVLNGQQLCQPYGLISFRFQLFQ